MIVKATTTPTPMAIAELMMRLRMCSSCSSTENWNRERSGSSDDPKRPAVTATTTFYLSPTVGGSGHGPDAREREFRDMCRHLNRVVLARVVLRPEARRDGVRHEQHPLRMNARDALQHPRMVQTAVEHLGHNRREIVDARTNTLIHERIEGRRRVVHLAVDQPGNPLRAGGTRRAAERDANVLA